MSKLSLDQLTSALYWEDVVDLLEPQKAIWDRLGQMFEILRYQNADPRLLQAIGEIMQKAADTYKALQVIEPCFQPQPPPSPTGTLPYIDTRQGKKFIY